MLSTSVPSTSAYVSQGAVGSWRDVLAPYSLGYRIKLLSQVLTRKFQERLEPFGLTPFHWLVLCCLWRDDGLPTSSIGEKLQQVGGTLTGVLDRMEERGLVRRERDTSRSPDLADLADGRWRKLESVLPPLAADLRDEAMNGISTADRELFSRLVDIAIANLS